MLEARRVNEWGQTGSVLAMLANVNRDPKRRKRPFGVADFVPLDIRKYFRTKRGVGLTKSSLHSLKPLFKKDK